MGLWLDTSNPYILNLVGSTKNDVRNSIYHSICLMESIAHMLWVIYRLIAGSIWCIWYISLGWILKDSNMRRRQ